MSDNRHLTEWYVGLQDHILAEPALAPLRGLFPAPSERMRDLDVCRHLHMNAIRKIRFALDSAWKELIVGAIDGYARGRLGVPVAAEAASADTVPDSEKLGRQGYVRLPPLEATTVSEMRAYYERSPVQVIHEGQRRPVPLAEARSENVAYFPVATNLGCPHLVEIASDPAVLATVGAYLGAPPIILNYSAWWSFAGLAEAKDAQLFHRDSDDYHFCKLFLYLTDVDQGAGPHTYMEGSHDFAALRALRRRWPGGADAFNNWYFGKLRKPDEEVLRAFYQTPVALTGPAGSRTLVDTGGIHKGKLPTASDRLVAQILYGVSPQLPTEYLEGGWRPEPIGAHPIRSPRERRAFDYANRLFLKD